MQIFHPSGEQKSILLLRVLINLTFFLCVNKKITFSPCRICVFNRWDPSRAGCGYAEEQDESRPGSAIKQSLPAARIAGSSSSSDEETESYATASSECDSSPFSLLF